MAHTLAERFSRQRIRAGLLLAALLWTALQQAQAQRPATQPIQLEVDASEAPRRIFHSRLLIPVSPGPLTLLYPKWIPGEHGPTGPVLDVAGLTLRADGRRIPWQRDEADMYTFLADIPSGVNAVEVLFDFLSPPVSAGGFSSGASATAQLAVISWNQLLLYPKGRPVADIEFRPQLKLPPGWNLGTALPVESRSGQLVVFKPVSLETLVDSPVLSGVHFREVGIGPSAGKPHFVELAADEPGQLEMDPAWKEGLDRLIEEAGKMFGVRHYRSYRFLLALSDRIAHFGLEHHESSDDRVEGRTLLDANLRTLHADLLPHEYVHSWNGKYRRPQGLATQDFQQPVRSGLLWVYEGLTQYLGQVLAVRSGLWTARDFQDNLARVAEWARNQRGRTSVPLVDTAVAAQLRYYARSDWSALRRGTDFYDEGALIWLDVDTRIRALSGGERSLDDFCRLFFGGQESTAAVRPYTMEELIAGLNTVAPFEWKALFVERVSSVSEDAPLDGIERGGWKLAYGSSPNDLQETRERERKTANFASSVGLVLRSDGSILDVIPGKVADRAGLAPGMKIVSVNSVSWSPEAMRRAMAEAARESHAIEVIADNDGMVHSYLLNYREGEKFPRLEREESRPDLLSQILKPTAR